MNKKDIVFTVIISEAIAGLLFLVWLNLGIFQQYWSQRWLLLILVPCLSLIGIFFISWIDKKVKINIFRIIKFALVGLLNTLLDFGILNLLSYLTKIYAGVGLVLFNTISFLVANLNSFFWNRTWTFKVKEGNGKIEFFKFFGVSLGGLAVNTLVLLISLEILEIIFPEMSLQIAENIAKLVAVLFSKFWNYFGYKKIVFKVD